MMTRFPVSADVARGLVFFILAAAVLFPTFYSGSPATAFQGQPRSEQAMKPLQYEVNVILKLIQVFVADLDGNPASDLEKDDFVLYDNGKLQKITAFEKHFIQIPDSAGAEPAVSETTLRPSPAAPLMKRKYIILFDNDSNDLEGISKSRKSALEFLDHNVQPGDEIAFFSCSTTAGLFVHEYFTSDHEKIREAIIRIKSIPGQPMGGLAVESFSEHELANPEHPTLDGLFSLFKDFGTDSRRQDYVRRDFIIRLTELAKALSQVDGQKNIILFSKEFRHIMDNPSDPDARRFQEMAKELASANCPVFVVNTTGGMEKALSGNAGLQYLSNVTGGKYYDDVGHYAENARSIRNVTNNFYVLGYSIGALWDGKFHDVRIEVARKGYKTFGQKGYSNPAPFNKLTAMEKSLHLIDVALGEDPYFGQPIDFPLAALPFLDRTGTNTLLLSLIPVKTIREDVGTRTEIISLVLAADKSVVVGRRAEVDWSTLSAETLCQYSAAALAPGRYECRVVVRNLETGKSAVGACAVEVPEASDTALKLFPPLFIGPYRPTQYVNFAAPPDKGGQAFSLSQAFLFPTRQYSPLSGELEDGAEAFRAVLRCERTGDAAQNFNLRAQLESAGGEPATPLNVSLIDSVKQGELLFMILEFRAPTGLAAGSYTLRIQAENPLTNTMAETASNLIVKQ
jgi:VWFA-related protein